MKRICVFCSSSDNLDPAYRAAAEELGRAIAERGAELVWGGARLGLMGILAQAAQRHGGRVTGVIPTVLVQAGIAYASADELIETAGLRERKAEMERRADAFVVLPGGFGTLEETLEIITLRQLGQTHQPLVILNVAGYYDGLAAFFERMYADGLAREDNRTLYAIVETVDDAMAYLDAYAAPEVAAKWDR